MSILVYTESEGGKLKKGALELASYAKALGDTLGLPVQAVGINVEDASSLGTYGISKAYTINGIEGFNAKKYAHAISALATQIGATHLLVSSSADARYVAPILSIKLQAAYVTNVVGLPESTSPLTLKRSVFTNKAFAHSEVKSEKVLIGLSSNAFGIHENPCPCEVETMDAAEAESSITVTAVDKATDKVSIADADVVVSGGRGLKGPENWHLIEDLADTLGAATACSKPVSDMGWRPHSEHVGQTGKPVASNLYIAVGVSGAIQHLAGINSSKVKVVINNDPEAPFFKAADYGIVGDAFEVVPELIQKLKAFKEA